MVAGLDIKHILDDVARARLLVIGDLMLDRYWWGSVDRISPEAPVPVVRLDHTSIAAGGAANVAINLAGLGCAVNLIGVTGADPEALEIEGILNEKNVMLGLVRSVERQTIVKTRIVAHGQHVVRIDQETLAPTSANEAEGVLRAVTESIRDVDGVILSDYGKGLLTGELLGEIFASATDCHKPVFVDPKGSKFGKYNGATVITPNQREAMTACSIDPHVIDAATVAGDELRKALGAAILITEGEKGMTLFERDHPPHHLDSFAREVFDVTGAGDTVIATFAAGVSAGRSMQEAAWLANAAAGIVVGKQGTTAISREMLEEFVASLPAEHRGVVSTA